MNKAPFIMERTFDAPVQLVWQAITEKEQMKQWYFDLEEFKPEPGFEFRFSAGSEEKQYLHVCQVKEVIPFRKISYSWVYDGYPGYSVVSFELFEEGNKTRVKLTHEGLESFPSDIPDFARKNFEDGWLHIIGTSLRDFVERKPGPGT